LYRNILFICSQIEVKSYVLSLNLLYVTVGW